MGIENLASTSLQSTPACARHELHPASSNPLDSEGATDFREHLAEQMADLTVGEATDPSTADGFNAEPFQAASGLPHGNLLPPPAVSPPQWPVSAHSIAASDADSPLPGSHPPDAAATSAKTVARVTPDHQGRLVQAEGFPVDASDLIDHQPSNEGSGRAENPDIAASGKALADSTAVVSKFDSLNTQYSLRTRFETDDPRALTLEHSVSEPEWKEDLGNRILWMTRNSMSAAEFKVNPPQMGPVEVHINLQQDQMNVIFASQNAAVREAIETAIPRLREMLTGQQFNLMHVEVSNSFADHHSHPNRNGDDRFHGEALFDATSDPDRSPLENTKTGNRLMSQGLLNYYV